MCMYFSNIEVYTKNRGKRETHISGTCQGYAWLELNPHALIFHQQTNKRHTMPDIWRRDKGHLLWVQILTKFCHYRAVISVMYFFFIKMTLIILYWNVNYRKSMVPRMCIFCILPIQTAASEALMTFFQGKWVPQVIQFSDITGTDGCITAYNCIT